MTSRSCWRRSPAVRFEAQPELPLAIRVDDGIRYQEMDGFGASFTDSSAWLVGTKLTPGPAPTS